MRIRPHLTAKQKKKVFRTCHCCHHVAESERELSRCPNCQKAFLPLNYHDKNYQVNDADYHRLFSEGEELSEDELVVGIYVVW